jgi:hypothetical protein
MDALRTRAWPAARDEHPSCLVWQPEQTEQRGWLAGVDSVIQVLRHAPPAQLPSLPGREPGPDALEVQVAHGVLEALVPHRASRAQSPGTHQIFRIP